jgi:hypothetical protein
VVLEFVWGVEQQQQEQQLLGGGRVRARNEMLIADLITIVVQESQRVSTVG